MDFRHDRSMKCILWSKAGMLILKIIMGFSLVVSGWNYFQNLKDAELLVASRCYETLHYPKELENFCLHVKVWLAIAIIGVSVGAFQITISVVTLSVLLKYEVRNENSIYLNTETDARGWKKYIATDCFIIWFCCMLFVEHILTFILTLLLAWKVDHSAHDTSFGYNRNYYLNELAPVISTEYVFVLSCLVVVILYGVQVVLAFVGGMIYLVKNKI